jgi:FkbM family methyltransferase
MKTIVCVAGLLQIESPEGDHITNWLRSGVLYEQDLLQAIQSLKVKGTYLDVGACMGVHTLFFARYCGAANVIAFEPQVAMAEIVVRNIARNGIAKAEVLNVAVHNTWKTCEVGSTYQGNVGATTFVEGDTVTCVRLDEVVDHDEVVGLIKIDVEGLEVSVIESARRIINQYKPIIVAEAHTEEAAQRIQAALPGYQRSIRFCATPTYIWKFAQTTGEVK